MGIIWKQTSTQLGNDLTAELNNNVFHYLWGGWAPVTRGVQAET